MYRGIKGNISIIKSDVSLAHCSYPGKVSWANLGRLYGSPRTKPRENPKGIPRFEDALSIYSTQRESGGGDPTL